MASIHNLSSKLTLNTTGFIRPLDRALDRTRQFTRSAGRMAKGAAKLGAAAGAAAIGGIALIASRHLAAIDATAKFADTIGMSTEALAGYRHAANLTGVEHATLDKGLQRLVRQMGDLRNGGSTAAKAFARIGLSSTDLEGKLPEDALGLIADKLNEQPDAAGKAAAAYELFGRQGQDMLKFLELGSEGLAETRAEAEQLGLTFSRVDAAKVEAANDAITRVKAGITGAGQSLTVGLAPYIEAAAEKLLGMGSDGDTMAKKITQGIEWVAKGIAYGADVFGFFKAAFYGAQAAVTFGLGVMSKGWSVMGRAIEAVINLLPGVEVEFSDSLGALGDELIETSKDVANKSKQAFADAYEGKNSQAVTKMFAEINAAAEENAQKIAAAAEAGRDATAGGMIDQEAIAEQFKNAEKVVDKLAELDKELAKIGKSEIDIKLADLKELGATTDQLEQARQTLESIRDHEARLKITADLDDLDAQIAAIGLDPIEVKLGEMKGLGATNKELEQARQKLEQIGRLERDQERQQDIAGILDDIEQQVRTFGLTDDERTLLDLDALGASADQIERAKDAMQKLQGLRDGEEFNQLLEQRQPQQLTRANSADAQRQAFQAARGLQPKDDVPKRQLDIQTRMASTLERIEQKQGVGANDDWSL